MSECVECGRKFEQPKHRGPKRITCSEQCRRTRGKKYKLEHPYHWRPRPEWVICTQCGERFQPLSYKHQLCSTTCRQNSMKKGFPPKDCAQCGDQFQPNSSNQKYCSQECSKEGRRLADMEYLHQKICAGCGRKFETRRNKQKYCTHGCMGLARRTLKNKRWECAICGAVYTPTYKDQTCCSNPCALAMSHKTLRKRPVSCICVHCGEEFEPKATGRTTFCSRECYFGHLEATRKSKTKATHRPRFYTHRQRARHYGVEYETIDRDYIFNRDNWTCHLCGSKIDPKIIHPAEMSATIDHVIPMSKGGAHTKENVRAAHFICNNRKHAQAVGEQMLLIG
jgi:hypothetical protein